MKIYTKAYCLLFIFVFIIINTILLASNGEIEFQVNTTWTNSQRYPSVATDPNGNFVITWGASKKQDGSGWGIYARRYDKNGFPLGDEFQVNTETKSDQMYPSVAVAKNGRFVIAWVSEKQDKSDYGIYAQRFNKIGIPLGSEFRVNTYTKKSQSNPDIAMDLKGNFVITWASYNQDGSYAGVYAQRYSKDGTPVESEFRVNITTKDWQFMPNCSMDRKGNFIITWSSLVFSYTPNGNVFASIYDSYGFPIYSEFQVNTYFQGAQNSSAVATDRNGNFRVTWASWEQDGSDYGVYCQKFNRNGNPIGPEIQVNNFTNKNQSNPSIAMNLRGEFVIAWESKGQDGSKTCVCVQRFNKAGKKVGPEIVANTYTDNDQSNPKVAIDKAGNFLVVWESWEQDGWDYGIFARIFKK